MYDGSLYLRAGRLPGGGVCKWNGCIVVLILEMVNEFQSAVIKVKVPLKFLLVPVWWLWNERQTFFQ